MIEHIFLQSNNWMSSKINANRRHFYNNIFFYKNKIWIIKNQNNIFFFKMKNEKN